MLSFTLNVSRSIGYGAEVGIERCRHRPVAPTQTASHGSFSTAACENE